MLFCRTGHLLEAFKVQNSGLVSALDESGCVILRSLPPVWSACSMKLKIFFLCQHTPNNPGLFYLELCRGPHWNLSWGDDLRPSKRGRSLFSFHKRKKNTFDQTKPRFVVSEISWRSAGLLKNVPRAKQAFTRRFTSQAMTWRNQRQERMRVLASFLSQKWKSVPTLDHGFGLAALKATSPPGLSRAERKKEDWNYNWTKDKFIHF